MADAIATLKQKASSRLAAAAAKGRSVTISAASIVPGYSRNTPRRGTTDLLRIYSESPILQAVIRKIATACASAEWVANIRNPVGDLRPVPGHMAGKLINGGVPGLDGMQCRMLEQTYLELVGESFAVLKRNPLGAPCMRWPIPPHWVRDAPSPIQDDFEIQPSGGSPFRVDRWDMIWAKDADPFDPYKRGVGVARSLADELNADEAAAKHAGASLTNRARPDIIISGSKEVPLQREDAERLAEVWAQRFGGPDNAGRPFVASTPITTSILTPSFKELELTKLREFERDIIVTTFGFPPELLGILASSNRATIESAEFLFSKWVIRPRLINRAAVYNEQLAPQYDSRLEMSFVDPVDEDKAFKLSAITARQSAFTDDEVRDLAGLDPLPALEDEEGGAGTGADVQGTAMNGAQIAALQSIVTDVAAGNIPLESAVAMVVVGFPAISEERARQMLEPAAAAFASKPPPPPPGALMAPGAAPSAELAVPDGEAGDDGAETAPGAVERGAGDRSSLIGPAPRLSKMNEQILGQIIAALDEGSISRVMLRNARSTVAEFASDALDGFGAGIDFDLDSPRAIAFLEAQAGSRSALITGSTRKRLAAALAGEFAGSPTQQSLIDVVQAVIVEASNARADAIARTETTRAVGFATDEAMAQAGLTEKEWLATQDERTRDTHADMDGQRVEVSDAFSSPAGGSAEYPGAFGIPEEDINCRCVVIAVDSLPEKAMRVEAWKTKTVQMDRVEEQFSRDLRRAFREQAAGVVAAIRATNLPPEG